MSAPIVKPKQIDGRVLANLRLKFPLPADVPNATMNLNQVAAAMNVTTLTVTKWLAAGLPTVGRGAKGKEYVFRLGDVWAWKKARDAAESMQSDEAQRAIQAMRMALVGGGLGSSIDALTPREKREVIATQREIEMLRRDRNELLVREDVHDVIETLFGIVRDGLDAQPDEVAREAGLSPKQIGVVVSVNDRTLGEMKRAIERFFADRPVGKKQKETLL